jgi:hypothetical protein
MKLGKVLCDSALVARSRRGRLRLGGAERAVDFGGFRLARSIQVGRAKHDGDARFGVGELGYAVFEVALRRAAHH